jgi:hypothetical protein
MDNEVKNKLTSKGFKPITTNLWKVDNWILYIEDDEIEIYENDVDMSHNKYFHGTLNDLDEVLNNI